MRRLSLLAILVATSGHLAQAQVSPDDPMRFVWWVGGDVVAGAKGLATPRAALIAGGSIGALLLLAQRDEAWARESTMLVDRTPSLARRMLHEVGNAKIIRPVSAVLFLGTLTSGNERLQDAAFTSFEAIVLANLVTNALKLAVGRARPDESTHSTDLQPFSRRRSFPSGHATTAFAMAMPWVLYYPGPATYALLALGAGTAFVRMVDSFHWFTDVVAGAAIGGGMAYLLTRRHQRLSANVRLSPLAFGGVGLSAVIRI